MTMRTIIVAAILLMTTQVFVSAAGVRRSAKEEKILAEVDALLAKGAERLRQRDHPRALALISKARTKVPDDDYAPVYYWRGLLYSDRKDYRAAAADAERAVLLDDSLAEAWLLWGQSLLYLKEWKRAKGKLDRANRLFGGERHPQYYLVLFNLGRYYFHGADSRGAALKHFRKVVELQPGYWPARLYIGYCLLAKNLPLPAAKAFKEVLQQQPGAKSVLLALGFAYRRAGKAYQIQAERIFLRIVARTPTYYQAHLQLCHLYLTDLPNASRAASHYQSFLHSAPTKHPWRAILKRYMKNRSKQIKTPPTP